jgi:hypothetical protein
MGRKKIDYETTRLTFQVPKELKCKLKEELSPVIKEKVKKWRAKK